MSEHSNSAEARDLAYHLHSFTHLKSLAEDGPLVLEGGDGIYVIDNQGRRYIEGISGLWNIVVGFSEERIAEAAYEQMKKLPAYHTFFGRTAAPVIDLAERLIELAPTPMKRVYFVNSGSEANDTAIKMLWMLNKSAGKPEKRKIISRKSAYHGTTVASCSLNGKPYIECFGLPLKEIIYTDCPHFWRYGRPGESEAEYAQRLADNLAALIENEGAETIAGFIAEPVMGAGGALVPPQGYFEKIEAVLRRNDIAFIADEVVCGFGRTGSLWGSQTYNFRPDIICTSKCLTAGYFPMGAVLMSPEIDAQLMHAAEALGEFPHGFTTAGHPVGAAIALKVLELITEPGGMFDNRRHVAPHFQAGLQKFADHPLVGEARGVGLIGALEIVADKASKTPFSEDHLIGEQVVRAAQRNGLILRPIGESIIFAPPFIISEAEIDDMFARTKIVLDEIEALVQKDGLRAAAFAAE